MENEHQDRRVELAGLRRQGEQIAFPELDVRGAGHPGLRRNEHRRLTVEADDLRRKGGEELGGLTGAATEVGRSSTRDRRGRASQRR
jgi:hypothetical protein